MMRISQREKVLFGYLSPQHTNCSSKVTNNRDSNSDIDFSDVFGGPPRRSSIHEIQHGSYNDDDTDLKSSCLDGDVNLDEGSKLSRSSWSGYGEKPVFGVEIMSKSRNRSDDFFDDIFRADQSLSYSPRMGARDPSVSAPGSRVLSPAARPLSSRAQPFGSPAQFSLPAGLPNTDSIASTIANNSQRRSNDGIAGHLVSSSSFLSRFSSQAIQNQDVLAHSTNRQSQLSELFNREALTKESASVGTNDRANFTEDLEGSEVPNEGSQFHFSIHKWATKGMPLIMSLTKRNSLRSREKSKLERCLSTEDSESNSVFNVTHVTGRSAEEYSNVTAQPQSMPQYSHQNIKETVPLDNCIMKSNALVFTSNSQEIVESGNIDVEEITAQPISRAQDSCQNINQKVPVDNCVSFLSKEETKESTLAPNNLFVDVNDEIHKIVMDKGKPNMKTLHVYQVEEKKVKDEVTTKDGNVKRVAKAIEILPPDGVSSFEHKKNGKLESLGEKLEKNEISGKVKDFVKIFNQDSSSKSTINVDGQNRSRRWKDTNSFEVENQAPFDMAKKQDGIQVPDINKGKANFYTCTKVKGKDKLVGQKVPNVNRFHENLRTSSPEMENITEDKEPVGPNSKPSTSSIDLTYEDVFVVTELPNTEKSSEDAQHQEEIQASENKIQRWSKGKEGNIRALLSTLQYVLWPDSGWKPVPLVDIIEANTVKRTYQKALLCLHPDKLQQKGAASHQKYIAQKVFDILQEAWDHFNSLGTL